MNAAQPWDESAQNSQTPPRTPSSDRAAAKTGTGSTQTNPPPAAAQIVPVNAGVQIPPNHLLRNIDELLDFGLIRQELGAYYSHTGRPSIDPELMIRMLLIGYCYSVRSERQLCEEVRYNLAYRWFCGLSLEDSVPDHSTFSKNRYGRFRESDVLRHLFEQIVTLCMRAGLVGGEGFAVDASVIEADASRYHKVEDLVEPTDGRDGASRPVREYFSELDSDNPLCTPTKKAKALSPSDPAAAWTTRGGRNVEFAYSVNHLVDLKEGVILDVEATPARRMKERQ